MRNKIILNLAVSLDGFIADRDGGYGWIRPSGARRLNTEPVWSHDRFLERIAAVVMGKRCYDQGLHADYREKPVYVLTTKKREDHENIHFIDGDFCREVASLRQTAGGDIYLFGGGIAIDPLLKAGLIDEYIIGIIPILLGDGIPLFRQGNPVVPLHLAEYSVEDGIVVLRYLPRSGC